MRQLRRIVRAAVAVAVVAVVFGVSSPAVGTLGGGTTHLIAVNDRGQILGTSQLADSSVHPVLWQCGVMIDVTTRGIDADGDLVDINDRGEIAGRIRPVFGISHAVLYR